MFLRYIWHLLFCRQKFTETDTQVKYINSYLFCGLTMHEWGGYPRIRPIVALPHCLSMKTHHTKYCIKCGYKKITITPKIRWQESIYHG